MNEQTLKTIFSGLLHDVGKMVYRAGENRDHASAGYAYLKERLKDAAWQDVLDGVRWHHAPALRRANAAENSTAYIVCVADNVAAAADRREIEGESTRFDRTLPLNSVFTHLNGEHPGLALEPCAHDGKRICRADSRRLRQRSIRHCWRFSVRGCRVLSFPKRGWIRCLRCWKAARPMCRRAHTQAKVRIFRFMII